MSIITVKRYGEFVLPSDTSGWNCFWLLLDINLAKDSDLKKDGF